ncbi:ESX-1 secretion-associated protein EspI [Mycobacterium simulans]|uniref:ESX-1 secretion-associated protein EspI n=1 Tax=Mycobacterium simulans TaxID=627089 RepID=A0A7Z7INS8_9MYCO|nr:MinD/ParA family protein [Mycobacterium simulans]SOJ57041.1 ESX-1 secretion-associated protein EspI [Mycobacterium simulans]
MTDNSDFMSRYLPPENPEQHREHAAPADDLTEEVSLSDLRLHEPAAPQPPQVPSPQLPAPPVAKYEFASPPAPGGPAQGAWPPVPDTGAPPASGTEGAHAAPPPPAAPYGPPARPSSVPPPQTGHPNAVPWSRAPGMDVSPPSGPISQQPAPIPPRPQFDQRNQAPAPPQRWAPPRIDPTQRWAPRADLQTAGSAPTRHVQVEEVFKRRREPAEIGWRKAVYACTGGLVNLGAGPYERQLRDWKARVTSNIPGNYQIASVSVKGGVGKTRVIAGVGTVFADVRGEHPIAIDGDTTYGGLGRFVDPKALTSIRDFLAAKEVVVDYPKARHFTGQNPQGLEVLAGNQNVANPMDLDAATFFETISLARRFYQLTLVDCGSEVETEFFKAVLSVSDALMIIGSCTAEGGLAIETTVDWLAARNGHELLKRSVIVLNDTHDSANKAFIAHITETVGPRVRSVKVIPWDPHLRDADTLDFPALRKRTKLAFLELAAELAEGFPTAGALSA